MNFIYDYFDFERISNIIVNSNLVPSMLEFSQKLLVNTNLRTMFIFK